MYELNEKPLPLVSRIVRSLLFRLHHYKASGRKKIRGVHRFIFRNKSGINLIGNFSYIFGVAEVGRFFAYNVQVAGIPFSIFDLESAYHKKLDTESLQFYLPHYTVNPAYFRNVFFINADQIPHYKQFMPELFMGRYNAAVFFWEFDDYFDFPEAFKVIDEVFAFTDFIATAVKKAAPPHIKVTKTPFPFTQSWHITTPAESVRKQYDLAGNTFVFIFNFDFYSVYNRKNPEAILQAFELAFNEHDNVCLMLKTIHADASSVNYTRFQSVIQQMHLKNKVLLINDNLERNEFMSMINACDCYISLHRSEGLGLGMLEAMSMGKPVIATNYGGNTDFTRMDNALLVDYTLVAAGEDVAPYKAGWLWAEPDIEQAAAYMHRLFSDRNFANELGIRAQESVRQQYNKEVFEKSIRKWMQS